MKKLLFLTLSVIPSLARALPAYEGTIISTATSRAKHYINGAIYVGTSSTATATTITIDGGAQSVTSPFFIGNLTGASSLNVLKTGDSMSGSLTTSSITIKGSACQAGPRPYIDVTCPPYNADPTANIPANAAFQAALNDARYDGATKFGGKVYVPTGRYYLSVPLTIYPGTTLEGSGPLSSQLFWYADTAGIISTNPVNSSASIMSSISNLGLNNYNATSTDAAILQICGSFFDVNRVQIQGFKYGVVYNQTEVGSVKNSVITSSGTGSIGVWLVNGDGYTNYGGSAADQYFTNAIVIEGNTFMGVGGANSYGILDEGGVNHHIMDNGFNHHATYGIYASGVIDFEIDNNEMEGSTDTFIRFSHNTAIGGDHVGPSQAVTIRNNSFGVSYTTNVFIASIMGGDIHSNTFGGNTGIYFSENPHRGRGIDVYGNVVNFANPGHIYKYDDPNVPVLHNLRQGATGVISSAISIGTQTVAVTSMVGINVGTKLSVINSGGQDPEVVTVSAIFPSSFTATFAYTHPGSEIMMGFDGGAGADTKVNTLGVGIGANPSGTSYAIDIQKPQSIVHMTSTQGSSSTYLSLHNGGQSLFLGLNDATASQFGGTGYSTVLFGGGAYPIEFYTNSTRALQIDSSQRLGIGTFSPNTKVHVSSGTIFVDGNNATALKLNGSGGGCMMIRDTDDAGWTECDALDGVLSCSIDADGVCD